MKVVVRKFKEAKHLLLVTESEEESVMIDEAFGSTVQSSEGFIAKVAGEVRLSDGYREHYIRLERSE